MRLPGQIKRILRPAGKYLQAIYRWKRFKFGEAPAIFGNAKPKSGSHLLLQILNGFCQIAPYAYVQADPIRTITKDGRRRSQSEVLADLQRIPQGVIGWGYLDPSPENVTYLCRSGRVNYFIYRDPRDMLISHIFFATDMYKEHGMHDFYMQLPNFNDRLKVAITGIDHEGLYMASVRQRYDSIMDWFKQPHVMPIRFEDLVDNRQTTLNAMLNELEKAGFLLPVSRERAIVTLEKSIQPSKSHTYRSGTTGGWRDYFTQEHKNLFREVAGDLLTILGYERDDKW
jgi:hypothetical protein